MDELARITALNVELTRAAAEGDWPRVGELDAERAGLLAALPVSGEPALRVVVEQSLAVTRALLGQAVEARGSVMAELRGLQRGQRGVNAYHRQP